VPVEVVDDGSGFERKLRRSASTRTGYARSRPRAVDDVDHGIGLVDVERLGVEL